MTAAKVLSTIPKARQPRLYIASGRGRSGKTFTSKYLLEKARAEGRGVMICDGDVRNGKLHELFASDASPIPRPTDTSVAGLTRWFSDSLNVAVAGNRSAYFDLGAGETASGELAQEVDLEAFLKATNYRLTNLLFMGPNDLDADHVISILSERRGIESDTIVFLNEGVPTPGIDAEDFFTRVVDKHGQLVRLKEAGGKFIRIPRLPCAQAVDGKGYSLYSLVVSIRNADGSYKINPLEDFMVRSWAEHFERNISEAAAHEWLP
ncbi:MAG: hypothetical protein ABF479_01105 [Gluconacetobacter sp.]